MKPVLMRHVGAISESFKAWKNGSPYVHNPFHYHPEIEITFIIKGSGTLIVGDKIIPYGDNELILIGPNVPHEWKSDITDIPDNYTQSISVHFLKNFCGEDFYGIPEAVFIKQLLDQSEKCYRVTDTKLKKLTRESLQKLLEAKGIDRVNILLSILNQIATTAGIEILSGVGLSHKNAEEQNSRINKINRYVMDNFRHQVSINEAAKAANLTSTSFCRFFRQRTHKSFIQYVNEIRIEYACKLLMEGNDSISQIAHESGFENISHFNTQFKKIVHITPTQFIKLTSPRKTEAFL
ncbi:AraC family transcriptional regulator [Flavihumibacter profundi]|jgi:AraC-like DNA-binding protein|uniref:AraC family transcriptional regulator n=1 Tax=Flavihumibacter profundi TaxID=2716883 RepID=UPI001CC48205|nr:AraC family transcriptional regulator [Flavihumibacter profundi]MBZ5856437.1 AraC family transcriptional regulator [Flavihumibacter profundi]